MRSLVALRDALLLVCLIVIMACTFSWEPISDALYSDSSNLEIHPASGATGKMGKAVHRVHVNSHTEGSENTKAGTTQPLEEGIDDDTIENQIVKVADGTESRHVFEEEIEVKSTSSEDSDSLSNGEMEVIGNPLALAPVVPDGQHAVVTTGVEGRFEVMSNRQQYAPFTAILTNSARYPPEDRPYLAINTFQFCEMLNGATFFTDLDIILPGISGRLDHSNAELFSIHLDRLAQESLANPDFQAGFQRSTKVSNSFASDSLKRGICWNVAQGNLQWWPSYVDCTQNLEGKYAGRIIRTINDRSAMPFLNYDGRENPQAMVPATLRQHYRLAYVLMVHRQSENVAALVDALADKNVFVYIHVELFATELFYEEIKQIVKTRKNVALMPTRFAVSWAHVSLIWVEIRAFFDLLDRISFEYVINLSGADYPLKSAKTIYLHLEKMPRSNWVWWKRDGTKTGLEIEGRTHYMFHCRDGEIEGEKDKCNYYPMNLHGYREFDGFKDLFPQVLKTSQWMILHRSTIEYLRSSEAGKLLLMQFEHTMIPDELFFSTFLAASPFNTRTFRDPKRLMFWYGGSHPWEWTERDQEAIRCWEAHFFWIRKVDVSGNPTLKKVLDGIRRKDKMSNRMVLEYKEGIIPVD